MLEAAVEVDDDDVAVRLVCCVDIEDLTAVALATFSLRVCVVRVDGCAIGDASSADEVVPAASAPALVCGEAAGVSGAVISAATRFLPL